jgi:carboxyl-terminal processing protease
VQEQYALKNGGALRLTTARYYTPSGRLIQKPYYDNGDANENEDFGSYGDTIKYLTSNGREVYSAGGITPDIKIESEYLWENPAMEGIYRVIGEFVFRKIETGYRTEAKDISTFISEFPSPEVIVQEIVEYADTHNLVCDKEFLRNHSENIGLIVRSIVGAQFFGRDAWVKIMNLEDPVVKEAIKVIREDQSITLKY